jgi:hypothetical protein
VNVWYRISEIVALGSASLAIAYGLYLLVIGPSGSFMTPDGVAGTLRLPTLAGVVPLAIGLVAAWAVVSRRTRGLWAAAALAGLGAVVFLFSMALQLAAIAALLVVAALLRTAARRDMSER